MYETKANLPLNALLRSLVHPSRAGDPTLARRDRAFIGGHMIAGLGALAVLPLYMALAGRPSGFQALAFAWLVAPLAVALFLSRTGRGEAAHLLSAVCLTGLVTTVAAATGGLASYALVWLAAVPVEAALSSSRRVIVRAMGVAGAGLAVLAGMHGAGLGGVAASGEQTVFAVLLVLGALAYAGGLAGALQRLIQDSEQAGRDSDARYELIADNVSDTIVRHAPDGSVLYASPACRALLGVAPEALGGQGLFERVHVGDRPAFLRALSSVSRERLSMSLEFRLRREPDAERMPPLFVWVEARLRPVPERGAAGAVAVIRDVGARKQDQAALQHALEEAELANTAKSRFLASMSHELRTPLNAVIGFSEILAGDMIEGLEPDRRREYARLIHESGTHLLQVVNDVLDVSRIEAGTFPILAEPFEVAPLVEGCCRMMHGQAAKAGLALATELAPDLPEIHADKRACRQVLINLLSNAIKFSKPGGRVQVIARRSGAMLALTVRDTGIGIAEADMPRLGTPFVQADSSYDRRYEGVGLGLSVVKGLMALHEGTFSIASEVGRGTDVTVAFPIAAEGGGEATLAQFPRKQAVGA